ncbi:hypothetical protein LINPERPRIM_LOCUS26559 [Linum perenne]
MHIYREGNRATNFLATHGQNRPLGTHEQSITDASLTYWLLYDVQRISIYPSFYFE